MKTGIAYANMPDARTAGRSCAQEALRKGNIERPDIVFAFCTGQVNHQMFYEGLRQVLGNTVPIIGGSAVGIITNTALSYKDHACGIAVIESDEGQFEVFTANDVDKSELLAGQTLGKRIAHRTDASHMFLFYDSVKTPPTETAPPIMNASPPIIKGIEETVRVPLPLVGAGLVGTYTFDPPRQFCGFSVLSQSLTGAVVRGKLYPYTAIMHGCTPKDGIYHTITKIEGPVVFELDNKPIVQAINEAYGSSSWKNQMPVKLLTLGINYGERYGAFDESNYVNRLIVGTLPDDLGVVLFEPDLHCGTEIQFMLRDGRKMIETARKNTRKLVEQIMNDGKKPCFGLYIDCAGRTAEYSDTLSEEAAEVQKILNEYQTPLLGFYSGVEIAPMLGKNRGLDWTGVLHILATD